MAKTYTLGHIQMWGWVGEPEGALKKVQANRIVKLKAVTNIYPYVIRVSMSTRLSTFRYGNLYLFKQQSVCT